MNKLTLVAAALALIAGTSAHADVRSDASEQKTTMKRARHIFPPFYYPDSGYGSRMPRSGPGTCGNSAWPCGPNNGGGDPGGSGGGGG